MNKKKHLVRIKINPIPGVLYIGTYLTYHQHSGYFIDKDLTILTIGTYLLPFLHCGGRFFGYGHHIMTAAIFLIWALNYNFFYKFNTTSKEPPILLDLEKGQNKDGSFYRKC